MHSIPTLTANDAATMLAAALEAARRSAVSVTIAVVDASGILLAMSRMDGARGYTVDLATRKARTAAAIGVGTGVLATIYASRPSPTEMMTMQGGLPVNVTPHTAGGIGVSGAAEDIDEAIAQAGLTALSEA